MAESYADQLKRIQGELSGEDYNSQLSRIRKELGVHDDNTNHELSLSEAKNDFQEPKQSTLDKVKSYFGGLYDSAKKSFNDNAQFEANKLNQPTVIDQAPQYLSGEKLLLQSSSASLGEGLAQGAQDFLNTYPILNKRTSDYVTSRLQHTKNYLAQKQQEADDEAKQNGFDLNKPQVNIGSDYLESLIKKNPQTTGEKIKSGLASFGATGLKLAEGLTTPKNLALLGAAAIPGVAQIEGAAFMPGLVRGALQGAKGTYEAAKSGDPVEIGSQAAQAIGQGAFAYGIGKSLSGTEPSVPVEKSSPKDIIESPKEKTFSTFSEKQNQISNSALLPQYTPETELALNKAAVQKINELPTTEDLSQSTPQAPKFKTIKGPETTRTVEKAIEGPSKTIQIPTDNADPQAYYDFSRREFVKDATIRTPVAIGFEKVTEPTGFTVREEVTPESPKTTGIQLDSMTKGRNKAVLFTPGESVPERISTRFKMLDTSVGTWVYDPLKVSKDTILKKVSDGTHGEILGHVEPKSSATTKAVAAIMPDGTEAKTSVVSPQNAAVQAEILKQQFPEANIVVGGENLSNDILNKRESGTKERGFIKSIKESENIPQEIKEQFPGQYEVQNQAVELSKAREQVSADKEAARKKFLNAKTHSGETVALGLELANSDIAEGNLDAARQIIEKNAKRGTTGGQASAMFAQLDRETPAGALMSAVQEIESARSQMPEHKQLKLENETKTLVDDLKKANKEALDEAVEKVVKKVSKAKIDVKLKSISQLLNEAIGGEVGSVGNLGHDAVKAAAREEIIRRVDERIKQTGKALNEVLNELKIDPNVYVTIQSQAVKDAQIQASQQASKDINRELKSSGTNIGEVVKKNFYFQDQTQKQLIDKLVNESGLTGEQAKELAKQISDTFKEMASAKKEQILRQRFARKANLKMPKSGIEKLIELSNLGAFDHPEFKEVVAEKLGFPSLTDAQSVEIARLSSIVEKTKTAMLNGGDRLEYGRSLSDLNEYIDNLKNKSSKLTLQDFKHSPLKSSFKSLSNIGGELKSIAASMDNSAIGRQGLKVLLNKDTFGIWAKNAAKSFVDFANGASGKDVMREVKADVLSRENAIKGIYKKYDLDLKGTEENYPGSFADRIPGFGRLFKGSEDAFKAFLLRTRADVFDKFYDIMKKSGADPTGLGEMVNAMTGRSNWRLLNGEFGKHANNLFFSPKSIASNIDFLIAHSFDKDMSPAVRKQAALNLIQTTMGIAGILAIANSMSPGSVEWDPRSSKFGKINLGKLHFDVTGGMGGLAVLASRLITGETKTKHALRKLNDQKFGSKTRGDVISQYFENKLSPIAAFVNHIYITGRGRDYKKATLKKELPALVTPIPVQSAFELYKDDANTQAEKISALILDALGVSANVY